MKFELATAVLCVLFYTGSAIKIYEWQRDWGNGVYTSELAQVLPDAKQIIYSATDRTSQYNIPSISLYLYDTQSQHFPNGVRVIRPLLSEGHQVCFIGHISGQWSTDYNTIHSRQGATIPVDFPPLVYDLDTTFPGDFDPLAVSSIRDFCDVERDHILYMNQTVDSVSHESSVLNIQGLFDGHAVIIAEKMDQTVLDRSVIHLLFITQKGVFRDVQIVSTLVRLYGMCSLT